ncbi:MAG: hypothetical protein ACR2LG_09220 [Actinomycetota bacterium]
MAFYKLSAGQAKQITASVKAHKEKDVPEIAEKNLETFFAVRFVQSEFQTGAKHRGPSQENIMGTHHAAACSARSRNRG